MIGARNSPCEPARFAGVATATGERELETRNALDDFLAGVERRAFRMAEFAIGNPDDALDVVQEAMMQLCQHYAQRDESEWRPLFYRILQNRIRDHFRRTRVRNRFRTWLRPWADGEATESGPVDGMQTVAGPAVLRPDKQLEQGDAMVRLQGVLRQLPPRQQQAFMLRIWEGLDVADTAKSMQCSAGSVKTHLSRALQRVREQLEAYADHEN